MKAMSIPADQISLIYPEDEETTDQRVETFEEVGECQTPVPCFLYSGLFPNDAPILVAWNHNDLVYAAKQVGKDVLVVLCESEADLKKYREAYDKTLPHPRAKTRQPYREYATWLSYTAGVPDEGMMGTLISDGEGMGLIQLKQEVGLTSKHTLSAIKGVSPSDDVIIPLLDSTMQSIETEDYTNQRRALLAT